MYAEVIVTAKIEDRWLSDGDRERGEKATKTRLIAEKDTRRVDVLASPNIDEVCEILSGCIECMRCGLLRQIILAFVSLFVCHARECSPGGATMRPLVSVILVSHYYLVFFSIAFSSFLV